MMDATQGEQLKLEGIKAVAANAAIGFAGLALEAIHKVALNRIEFTCDDVWIAAQGEAITHDNRALGPVMKRAQTLGWIEPTDRFTLTSQPLRHRAPIRVWRSLLLRGDR